MRAAVILPHQLFNAHPALELAADPVYLLEHPQCFTAVNYHAHKLVLHRASMAAYAENLRAAGRDVRMVSCVPAFDLAGRLKADGIREVVTADCVDFAMERSLRQVCAELSLGLTTVDTPAHACPPSVFGPFFAAEKGYRQTSFYTHERKRLGILMDGAKPKGGKWTYDVENRNKLPKNASVPKPPRVARVPEVTEAIASVRRDFPQAPGDPETFNWPVNRDQALEWLQDFCAHRLPHFGDYQDAIPREHQMVYHSLLSSSLNIGLLTPLEVVDAVEDYGREHKLELNQREGFIRQVLGWREYVRALYVLEGESLATANALNHTREMPKAFYDATTGLEPVDHVIRKVLATGYAHHIERLMVLGNIMLLCGIAPGAVYTWFLELFIDAYDWVMVPNVYGMSQFADGGLMMTKPYISGSNYILKMSDHPRGEWCAVWDGLFWRFIDLHRDLFAQNPRTTLMAKRLEAMDANTLKGHHRTAETFLKTLW